MKRCAILLPLLLSACASSEIIYMKNVAGEVVRCGPYTVSSMGGSPGSLMGGIDQGGRSQLRQCVGDYEVAGYRRTPGPN